MTDKQRTDKGDTVKKEKRIVVKMTEREYSELEALARVNTSGNASQVIRSLVKRAYLMPSEFGLVDPRGVENGEGCKL